MNRQEGFTLIEVLIAILIVAVGVLGVAGMQVVSLQQNRNALLRDTAVQLASDMTDRMLANENQTYAAVGLDTAPSFITNCNQDECNTAAMAQFDVAHWKCRLNPRDVNGAFHAACTNIAASEVINLTQAALPDGKGSIALSATGYDVTVEWTSDSNQNKSQVLLQMTR